MSIEDILIHGARNAGRLADVAPPGKLQAVLGDVVRVTLGVRYRGQAINGGIHVSFGYKNSWFNEDGAKQKDINISLGPDNDWKDYTFTADISIGGSTGTFDMYAKIMGVPGPDIFTPDYLDVLEVIGEPEFDNFRITDYTKV